MRLWSIHPRYLDTKGLLAEWREALLAQAVLLGKTKGYTAHPQLVRFRALADPVGGIGAFLSGIADEADRRGYRFDRSRIVKPGGAAAYGQAGAIPVTDGQVRHEWTWFLAKMERRSPERYAEYRGITRPEPHPLFFLRPGPEESWEKGGKSE